MMVVIQAAIGGACIRSAIAVAERGYNVFALAIASVGLVNLAMAVMSVRQEARQ